ncbi:MAG TPA: polysaccharide biosynthesis/export family protein [Terriglobales bacterium]|jgi:polysaccharide biosynthesis/export protein|nr:polysaccharide biosynthesis/export family protein [Terriglobales bacterium]
MRRRTAMWISLALALASLPALAAGQASTSANGSTPASQAGPTYVIGPDDTLYISVWKEPDLTETLPVRADGKISMPLLNDVQAAGLTPMQLGAELTDKLKKYVSDPRVTIVVTQMNSQRVYVTGEVLHPGAMNLTPNMTVLQALSSAGFTQFANTKGIYVLRNEHGNETKLAVNYKKLIKGEGGQNIALKPGDTIVVP